MGQWVENICPQHSVGEQAAGSSDGFAKPCTTRIVTGSVDFGATVRIVVDVITSEATDATNVTSGNCGDFETI